MDVQVLQAALAELPGAGGPAESGGVASAAHVRALAGLVESDVPLQTFLEQLLPLMCDLFAAPAAVAWMKTQGTAGAVFGVRYRMDQILSSIPEQKKHERLVQVAWQQRTPMLAEPAPATAPSTAEPPSAETNNPTGHLILFGPILHFGEPVALLEIVLPKFSPPLTSAERQFYLRCGQLVADRVYGGLRQRMALPTLGIAQALEQLKQVGGDLESMQQQIRRTLEKRLQPFYGWSFASLGENQEFAKFVHQLLDSHGLRVKCPECGNPAILRCLRAGNAKHGAFVFDHYLDSGRTFHGGPTTVPLIRVVPKPARRIIAARATASD